MNRIEELQKIINNRIESLSDIQLKQKAYIHSYGVAQTSALLAERRGVNPELAYVCGLLHDIYAYEAGTYEDHCAKGAVLAEEILKECGLFNSDEVSTVKTAIANHDLRKEIHSIYDEILKDSDILQPYLNSLKSPTSEDAKSRLINSFKDLGIEI